MDSGVGLNGRRYEDSLMADTFTVSATADSVGLSFWFAWIQGFASRALRRTRGEGHEPLAW